MEPNTSTLNNFFWYLLNLIVLMGPFTMFMTVEVTSWKHIKLEHFKQVVVIISIIVAWIGIVGPLYYMKGDVIGYWAAAFLHIDSFWGIRMLKVGFYSFMYFKFGVPPTELDLILVYIPVAYSMNGILLSKLFGYKSKDLIKDFTYILIPLLAEQIWKGHKLKGSFVEKYIHAMLFMGVITLAVICILLPRVVPPRFHHALDDLEAGPNAAGHARNADITAAPNAGITAAPIAGITAAPNAGLQLLPRVVPPRRHRASDDLEAGPGAANPIAPAVVVPDPTVVAAEEAERAATTAATDPAIADLTDAGRTARRTARRAALHARRAVRRAVRRAATENVDAPGTWTLSHLLRGLGTWLNEAADVLSDRYAWIEWSNPGNLQEYDEFYRLV